MEAPLAGDSNITSATPGVPLPSSGIDATTILAIVTLNAFVTVTCACVVTCVIVMTLSRRRQHRELRDKLGSIVATMYWPAESDVSQLLRAFETMRFAVLFRDVTALDVLAYKYRFQQPDGSKNRNGTQTSALPTFDAFVTLKQIERLFDSLVLQLPIRGRRSDNGKTGPIGRTLCGLARTTAPVWSDERAAVVRRLVIFFGGAGSGTMFDGARLSDDSLERRIRLRLPYAVSLMLSNDRFVLSDISVSGEMGAFDLRSKVRFLDERLSSGDVRSFAVERWSRVMEAYRTACDITLSFGFIQSRANFPEYPAEFPKDDEQAGECITLLRHLLRLMCGVQENLQALCWEDRFLRFVADLHGIFYGWTDAPGVMLACVERSRANVIAYARSFTADQMLIDPELTRSTLERVECELYRHLDYLTVRRVQMKRQEDGHGDHTDRFRTGRQQEPERTSTTEFGLLRPVESETSVYTMAASYMLPTKRPTPSPRRGTGRSTPSLVQQHSTDRGSIVSFGSSLYATAASYSSEIDSGSLLRSPGLRQLTPAPGPASSDSETEYFETPV